MTDEERPEYLAMQSPALNGLAPFARAQVVQRINLQLIVELLDERGGSVDLPPGFGDRVGEVGQWMVGTRFLDDRSYHVYKAPLRPEYDPGVSQGMRFERTSSRVHDDDPAEVYQCVGTPPGVYVEMQRVEPRPSRTTVMIRASLIVGQKGWKPWTPPPGMIAEALGFRL